MGCNSIRFRLSGIIPSLRVGSKKMASPVNNLIKWRMGILSQSFPGRTFLGRLYRFLLFALFDPALKWIYRFRIALQEKRPSYLCLSDYRLLKEVRSHFPAPPLLRRWARTGLLNRGRTGYEGILLQIHAAKFRTRKAPWILPETALFSPSLDCKGFAVLFSSLLNAAGIRNQLWIGLPSDGKDGHAWVVLETDYGRIAVDQFNGDGIRESVFLLEHPYAIRINF